MTKGLKIIFGILIILVGALAALTGYFYAKSAAVQKGKSTTTEDTTKKITDEASTKESTETSETKTSTVTQAAPSGNRPSSPTDTVTVAQGETLFAIGQKAGVSWTVIADANGIDANKIQAGQTLIIPKNNQISYTVNQEKAGSLQKETDSGKNTFRLSAAETAKSDSSPAYGLTTDDTFTQGKLDEAAGTAEVTATHGDKTYLISLTQPVTKGAKGIWAIESIKPSQ